MPDYNPKVSIVILTRKVSARLEDELNKQTYRNFEIIYPVLKGIVPAMNEALRVASGEIFVRIDDDVSLPDKWLEELIKPFSGPKVCGVTGGTFVPLIIRDNRYSIKSIANPNWFIRWMFDNDPYRFAGIYNCGSVSYGSNFQELIEPYLSLKGISAYWEPDHLEGTNWAMRTELIRKVGGFDPKFNGVAEWYDDDVVFKVKKMGYRLVYNPKAYLWHLLEKTEHYEDRLSGWSRLANWTRFHYRHSKFHYKKIIWFMMLFGYCLLNNIKQCLKKR